MLSEAYAEDAVLLVAGIPPICGFAAIRQFVEMIRSSGVRDIMIDIERCEISGDLAYLWGRYIIKVLADGGDRMDYGKILEVWRNLPQGWRMVADAVSPDQVPGA